MKKGNVSEEAGRAAGIAMKIPGRIRKTEAEFLYRLARRKGNVLEIGCLYGRSTSVLVQAAAVFKAQVTSIDPFNEPPKDDIQPAEYWRSNLKKAGLTPPAILEMTSHEAAQKFNQEVAFLFIDGNHSFEAVTEDLHDWAPKMKVGGVIALHDMFMPHIAGVAEAVTDWWLNEFDRTAPKWRLQGMVDFTIAFRRER